MRSLNKVMLIGRLGKDPEVTNFESGAMKTSFSLATDDSYKDREGNKIERTDWHNIVMWRGLAKIAAQYLKKGSLVYLEGKIKSRSYDDKDGNKRYITEIEVGDMQMLSSSPANNSQQSAPISNANPSADQSPAIPVTAPVESTSDLEDDLPF
ncbi:UNVERIFIED_CONTAM: hypothetical protein GTU68_011690 [Idotea baltica]|nr:hypothetical protein [Idotea baltica]